MRRSFFAATLLALAASLSSSATLACATCGCGDPTLTAMGVEKPFLNRVRLSFDERFGGGTSGDPGVYAERFWTLRSQVAASWSPHRRITLLALVPFVAVWTQTGGPTDAAPWRSGSGLGDAELSARAVVFRERDFSPHHLLSIGAGLKLPTGPRAYDTTGYPLPDDDQPGSGSWDPFAALSYGWFGERVALFSSVGYRFTTAGWHGYRRGMSLGATVGVQVQPWTRVAFSVAGDLRWTAADTFSSGAAVPNTGGTSLAITPALLVSLLPDWLVKVSAQVHLADWLDGVQSESSVVMLSTVVDLN